MDKKMSARAFEARVQKTRLRPRSVLIARYVLVENMALKTVASAFGLTKQRVFSIARAVLDVPLREIEELEQELDAVLSNKEADDDLKHEVRKAMERAREKRKTLG